MLEFGLLHPCDNLQGDYSGKIAVGWKEHQNTGQDTTCCTSWATKWGSEEKGGSQSSTKLKVWKQATKKKKLRSSKSSYFQGLEIFYVV